MRKKRALIGFALASLSLLLFETPAQADASADAGQQPALPTSQQIAERLAGALRFPTISHENPADFDGAPFAALRNYLQRIYPRSFAALKLETVNEHSLLFEWRGQNPALGPALFMSHLDVVPVDEVNGKAWTHPPFAGVIEDGVVWGRGALDAKIGVILWLEATEALLAQGFEPERSIYLAFGHDEEIGGERGARAIAGKLAARGLRLALLFDEGGSILDNHPLLPGQTVAQIATAEKTYFTLQLVARGRGGHSSLPPRHTAVGRLASAIHRLEANPMPLLLTPPVREMLQSVAPFQPVARRLLFQNLWLTAPLVKRLLANDDAQRAQLRSTMAATIFQGGIKENVLPERARAWLNFRILPGETPDDVLKHVRRVIKDPSIEIEAGPIRPAPKPASVNNPGFRLARDAIRSVLPDAIVIPGMLSGATDSLHYAGIARDVYRFIPAHLDRSLISSVHGHDERIPVAPLAQSAEIALNMMRHAGSAAATGE